MKRGVVKIDVPIFIACDLTFSREKNYAGGGGGDGLAGEEVDTGWGVEVEEVPTLFPAPPICPLRSGRSFAKGERLWWEMLAMGAY